MDISILINNQFFRKLYEYYAILYALIINNANMAVMQIWD